MGWAETGKSANRGKNHGVRGPTCGYHLWGADSLPHAAGLCWILGQKAGLSSFSTPPTALGAFRSSQESGQEHLGLASVLVLDPQGAHHTSIGPFLGADWLWGKGYTPPHPHSRAKATVWRLQAGRLGVHRNHTCCHSCLLLASSKFQTCQWWARAGAAAEVSPRRTSSAPETQ